MRKNQAMQKFIEDTTYVRKVPSMAPCGHLVANAEAVRESAMVEAVPFAGLSPGAQMMRVFFCARCPVCGDVFDTENRVIVTKDYYEQITGATA